METRCAGVAGSARDDPCVTAIGAREQRDIGKIAGQVVGGVVDLRLPHWLGIYRRRAATARLGRHVIAFGVPLQIVLTECDGAAEAGGCGGDTVGTRLVPGDLGYIRQRRTTHRARRGGKILAGGAVEHIGEIRTADAGDMRRGGEGIGVHGRIAIVTIDDPSIEAGVGSTVTGRYEYRNTFDVRL